MNSWSSVSDAERPEYSEGDVQLWLSRSALRLVVEDSEMASEFSAVSPIFEGASSGYDEQEEMVGKGTDDSGISASGSGSGESPDEDRVPLMGQGSTRGWKSGRTGNSRV